MTGNQNDDFDFDLSDALHELVDLGIFGLNSIEYELIEQVIDHGYNSLSVGQRIVYDGTLLPLLKRQGYDPNRKQW